MFQRNKKYVIFYKKIDSEFYQKYLLNIFGIKNSLQKCVRPYACKATYFYV